MWETKEAEFQPPAPPLSQPNAKGLRRRGEKLARQTGDGAPSSGQHHFAKAAAPQAVASFWRPDEMSQFPALHKMSLVRNARHLVETIWFDNSIGRVADS